MDARSCHVLQKHFGDILRTVKNGTVWFAMRPRTSFANSHISRISFILAEEMNRGMSEKSSAILRHILMRSFDAAYRMGGKSLRVPRCVVPKSSAAGRETGRAHLKLCRISISHFQQTPSPVRAASVLWQSTSLRNWSRNVFSRFTIRPCGQILYRFSFCSPSSLSSDFVNCIDGNDASYH